MATLYPTWNRFLKIWKTIVFPVIKQSVNVVSYDKPTTDEEYEVTTRDNVDAAKIYSILDQIQDVLISKGYDVELDKDAGLDGCDITINGKDRYDPEIGISMYIAELYDDDILYSWDDARWADWDEEQDDFGFKLSYSKWIKDNGIVDKYDNILKAPKKVQKSYCEWVRSVDDTRLWISIIYAE